MADWSSRNILLTTKGAAAISKVQSGSGKLTITKVVASEQYVSESALREVTSLSVENLPLTIIDRHEVPDGGSVIQVQLNNLKLGNPFIFNEIGVFATHSDNPSEEFLYIIAQVNANTGDRIPLYSTTPITATYDIYLYNVSADNIEVTISSSGLVTYEALNEACKMVKRSTSYEVGDIRYSSSVPIPYYLRCKVKGKTSSSSLVVPSDIKEGDTITDGTVVWGAIRLALHEELKAFDLYLPLSGGTMKGDLTVPALHGTADNATNAGNAAKATKVVTNVAAGASTNIAEVTMAENDFARIRVSGANNAGELALETADDGNEAIVARQYTGDFKDVARTASILDTNGNTSFPGTVVAPKFTGALNGNAATASKLASPRTISLTGKAAGSTSFDGSANAAINVTSVNADTASKLSSARKINIVGDATGAANFDGTGDISINTTVNESKHAAAADRLESSAATETSTVARPVWLSWEGDNTKQTVSPNLTYTCASKTLTAANFKGNLAGNADTATADKNGADITVTYLKKAGDTATGKITFNSTDLNMLPEVKKTSDDNMSGILFSSKSKFLGAVGKRLSNGEDLLNLRSDSSSTDIVLDSRNYNNYAPTKTGSGASGTWPISISGNAATATTATSATTAATCTGNSATASKLATARSIALTGNATGSANFDGSGNISISTNVNTATNADTVDGYHASDIIKKIYPVGSIYMSMSATNPHDLFGVGTWERISQGRMLLGADDSTYEAGATGGEEAHTLSADEMPAHSHGISNSGDHTHFVYGSDNENGAGYAGDGIDTGGNNHLWDRNNRYTTSSAGAHTHTISNAGGGAAHNNMPPYLVCYIWQRTA